MHNFLLRCQFNRKTADNSIPHAAIQGYPSRANSNVQNIIIIITTLERAQLM